MKAAGLSPIDNSIVTYDSAKALGDDGQVRNLMISYIQKNKTITPTLANNWNLSKTAVTQQSDAATTVVTTSSPLPKTGSFVDTTLLISFSTLIILVGIVLLFGFKKEENDKDAA